MVICLLRDCLGIDLHSLGIYSPFLPLLNCPYQNTSFLTFALPILPPVLLGEGSKEGVKKYEVFSYWPGPPTTHIQKSIMCRPTFCVVFCVWFSMEMSLDTSNVSLETHFFCRLEKYMDVTQNITPKMKWKIFSEARLVS